MTSNNALRKRFQVNRRAFLRGLGGVAIGLPFLESLPQRSAWAADAPPVFSFFICGACGVVPSRFFPNATGPLTSAELKSSEKAVAALHAHAPNLLFARGINFPMNGGTGCSHAQGLAMTLTGKPSAGSGSLAYSGGPSADMVIAQAVNADGADPMTLYAGNRRNGYIAERLSFKAAGAGQIRPADDNPYKLYSQLVGLSSATGGQTPEQSAMAAELAATGKSVNDCVRDDLETLLATPVLSAADRQRIQQHLDGLREVEKTMTGMAAAAGPLCSTAGLSQSLLDSWQTGFAFSMNGMIEDVARVHMELVALAFACAYNRVACMQWGDGTDQTRYNVPSNADLNWPFHHLSHRVQSDSTTGNNSTAEAAHAEIDALRMKTLAAGLDHFHARGLADKCFVMWTNHIAEGPSHSYKSLPYIIWGNAGGYLKNGVFVDGGNAVNGKLLNTLILAGTQDKPAELSEFGDGTGTELDVIKA